MKPDGAILAPWPGPGPAPWPAALLLVVSTGLAASGSPVAPFGFLVGLAVLLGVSRFAFVAGAVVAVPLSTLGWDARIGEIGGHVLDARLVVTFGVTALVAVGLALERPRPTRVEWLVIAFAGLLVAIGLLRSDSAFTWAPAVARWAGYAGMFVLARACAPPRLGLPLLAGLAAAAFAVPTGAAIGQFLAGESPFINGATRATAPGGRGPLAVAFAGQLILVIGYVLPLRVSVRLAVSGLGLAGIVASAGRLTALTAVAAIGAYELLCRRPRRALVVPLLLALVLVAQPGLQGRLATTHVVTPGAGGSPDAASADESTRLRYAVWRVILEEWSERPVLGIGTGMTAPTYEAARGVGDVAPHNDYIGVLAEEGLVGLALFVPCRVP